MNKKTIIIGAFSTLLITGGVAGAAAVLINSTNASKEADTQTIFTKTNIEFLIKSLQDGIDQYKLTRTKFSDQNYVDFVKNSLYSKDKKAGHLITNVEYLVSGSNEEILISLNKKFDYSLDGIVPADNLATYDSKAKTITLNVSTLEFYKAFEIQNLGGLYDLFNDKVLEPTNLYTSSEFLSYINNNNAIAKSEITNFLKVNVSSRSADTLEIDTLVFEENLNKLEITLKDNGRIDYTTTINSPNVTLNNNIITVSNFTFYTAYQLQKNKIDTFKETVQNYINSATNQYTLDEFNDQLDSQAFKTEIAAHFSIPESAINRIEFSNDILKITPPAMTKFVNEANKIISDIQVKKLNFYTAQDLINLETLYNAIKNYILDSTRKYTLNEFDNEVENNSNAIKTLISQNLYIAENQNISLADILSVDFNDATKKLEITLQNNYKKYNLTPAYNVDLIDNKLIISNLTFYEGIQIEPTKLDNFQNNIQGFINDLANQYTLTEFTDQITSTSFKALISSSLGIPLSSINEIKFEKSTLTITTNDMKKFVSTSTSNVLSNGELVVTGLQFYTAQSLVKLDGLYSAINNYIINPARKFTLTEFTDAANNISNATIKQLVTENLYISETQKIDANEIDTVNFNEATQELEISLNVNYKKYSLEQNNKVEWKNGKLIVKNFTFYTAIQIEEQKLNDLQSFIQDYINSSSNQFTQNEFTNQINSEDFTNQIATHLGINKLSINNISFTNNSLFINPLTLQKFTTTAQNNSLVAGSIVVNNFQFFTEQSLVRLESLYSALNSYIVASNRKYTAQEFSTQITNNNDEIKNIVLNNLYISQTETIDPDKVSKVSFNAENQLEITFTNDYIKYQFTENDNFELDGYKLLVKNLTFYTAANITNDNLNNLGTKIQEYINKPENQFLLSEFQSQIDSRNFKKVIADALSISSDAIGNVIYSSDTLKIQPANLYKFVPEQQSSLIVGNNIQIQNLMFYTGKTFINLQNLYNAVNNYIIDSSRKFTAKEFKKDIPTHMSDLKTLVIRNLQTSNAGAVAVDEIDDISLNADNNFVITLNDKSGNYFKYSVQSNSNVVLEDGNKLVIKNLTYYTDLTISDDNLKDLWTSVNNFIAQNAVTVGTDGNISGYLNYRIFDLFKAVKTVENQSLGEFINGNPVHSLSSIQSLSTISVRIKSGLYKMTSKNLNNGDIKVENNNSISLNNLQLTSPESYFNWNGNAITGLTSVGRQQSVLAIPLRCTKINASAFTGLTNIRQVKISENVTSIESSAFKNCSYLNTVEFREGITNIGPYSFSGTVLSTVAIPNSVTHIRDHAFYQCNSLTKYTINHSSSKLSLFDQYAFGECRNLSSVIIPSSCREIQPNAFAYSTQLRHVDMYSTQITMYNYAFTFDNYWGPINIYFYNLTNASNLSMTNLTFDYQNPTKLYFYVRNSTMINALRPILSQHSPANFELNTF